MKEITTKYFRIMAIAPSTSGLGYAVFEGQETLLECDIKTANGDKNAESLRKIEKIILYFKPDVLVLENTNAIRSRRSPRIRKLTNEIIAMAKSRKIKVKLLSRDRVMRTLIPDGKGTKHSLATILAQMFSEQLDFHLPAKRKLWDSEHPRMAMFDAVALAVVWRLIKNVSKIH